MAATSGEEILPFRIEVPQADLDDLQDRLRRVRWAPPAPDEVAPDEVAPDEQDGTASPGVRRYGVSTGRLRQLVERWRNGYDWRSWEARLNSYPQFITGIDGQRVHFLHVRSQRPNAFPLILTHGWPGSVVEFLDVIDRLIEPDAGPAFDLVIPSLPGFGWSGPTTTGWGPRRIARAWATLMQRLGYRRYGAAGNDWGSVIAPELGRVAPDAVLGVHVTQLFGSPPGYLPYAAGPEPDDLDDFDDDERRALQGLHDWLRVGASYHHVQAEQPQTLAHALADSPVGLLGWNSQVMGGVDDDFLLTQVTLHWLTGTAGSAIRIYAEDAAEPSADGPTTVPLGLAQFRDDLHAIRRYAERDHARIVSWHDYDTGGHYATHTDPELYSTDLRNFFAGLLTDR
ncbi:epoxide hydrolase family protein [Microlunatus soli]|uniref:epoxide hydrolase family protein n=1 Tax=Microlunatus soli TaxID=630515 RepID=UPI001E43FA15|nr:epoxide hydrolase family protein [Microlunatus soli]